MEKGKPKKKEKGRDSDKEKSSDRGSKSKEPEKERNGTKGKELERDRSGSKGKEVGEKERNGKGKEPLEKERTASKEKEPEKKNGRGRDSEKERQERRVKEGEKERSGRPKELDKDRNGAKSKESEEKRKDSEKEKAKEKEKGKERAKEDKHREEKNLEKEQSKGPDEKEKENKSALTKPMLDLPDKNKQILVLGLDGAGKTSLLHSFALNRVQHSCAPTEGFNAVCINTDDSQMEFLEIGGSEAFRPYWQMYLPKGLLLVFVVDSADHHRLPEAKKHLHQLIGTNPLLPLVVFANKQDLDTAYHITDIHDALALSEVGNERKMFLFGTQVTENGSEIPEAMQDARDLIAQLAADMQ